MTTMRKGFIVIIVLAALAWIATATLTKRWREGGEKKATRAPAVAAAPKPYGKAVGLSAPTESEDRAAKAKDTAKPAAQGKPVLPPPKPVTTQVAQSLAPASKPANTPPVATPSGTPPAEAAPKETLQEITAMIEKGGADKEKAWAILTRKLLTPSSDAEREETKKLLDEVNKDLMFSKTPTSFSEQYVVQRGDTLTAIAKRHQSTLGLIYWANQKSSDRIVAGERLKVPTGKIKLVVQKQSFRLIVLFNNNYVKEYPIAIGKSEKTPAGTFIIEDKAPNPNWYAPDGKLYKFGDDKNILGTRWLRFKETAQYHGLGIHGTAEKERDTIGKAASAGCIRMLNENVEELYEVVPLGTEVVIME